MKKNVEPSSLRDEKKNWGGGVPIIDFGFIVDGVITPVVVEGQLGCYGRHLFLRLSSHGRDLFPSTTTINTNTNTPPVFFKEKKTVAAVRDHPCFGPAPLTDVPIRRAAQCGKKPRERERERFSRPWNDRKTPRTAAFGTCHHLARKRFGW